MKEKLRKLIKKHGIELNHFDMKFESSNISDDLDLELTLSITNGSLRVELMVENEDSVRIVLYEPMKIPLESINEENIEVMAKEACSCYEELKKRMNLISSPLTFK